VGSRIRIFFFELEKGWNVVGKEKKNHLSSKPVATTTFLPTNRTPVVVIIFTPPKSSDEKSFRMVLGLAVVTVVQHFSLYPLFLRSKKKFGAVFFFLLWQ
jgi:hypothetical protein